MSAPSSYLSSSPDASVPSNASAQDTPLFRPELGAIPALFHLLTHPKIFNYVQLFLLGLAAEISRRLALALARWVIYHSTISSSHNSLDESYDWLMAYWTQHPSWRNSARNFACETAQLSMGARVYPWLILNRAQDSSIITKNARPSPYYVPNKGEAHFMFYRGTLVRFVRPKPEKGDRETLGHREQLKVIMLTRNKTLFIDLLAEAKAVYLDANKGKLTIKAVDESSKDGSWRDVALRHPRALSSVITEDGVKEKLLKDIKDFLDSEQFYVQRGIPWRRGILLHGLPGSGKTSTILAVASEMKLDVYVFSLATSGMTDAKLNRCMTLVPAGAVVVMEDIDVALTSKRGKAKRSKKVSKDEDDEDDEDDDEEDPSSKSSVTLSGLLNAIDGIAGSEGRVLFMTTNHRENLDPALIRPGRADLSFQYYNASQKQAEAYFKVFYGEQSSDATDKTSSATVKEKHDPLVTSAMIDDLAKQWAAAIPERDFSSASLQGMLMEHKHDPEGAVADISSWVADRYAERERIQAAAAERLRVKEEARAERLRKRAEAEAKAALDSASADKTGSQAATATDQKNTTPLTPPDTPVAAKTVL